MKLTKLQRYTVYCIMLAEYESKNKVEKFFLTKSYKSTDSGFCLMCNILFDDYYLYGLLKELIKKETMKYFITRDFSYLFKNNKERISALKECIKETHP